MGFIWRLRIIYSLYMKKNEYSKPAISYTDLGGHLANVKCPPFPLYLCVFPENGVGNK